MMALGADLRFAPQPKNCADRRYLLFAFSKLDPGAWGRVYMRLSGSAWREKFVFVFQYGGGRAAHCGSLAMFAAILRASSLLSYFAAERRPGLNPDLRELAVQGSEALCLPGVPVFGPNRSINPSRY
jgi:hypothetical protein